MNCCACNRSDHEHCLNFYDSDGNKREEPTSTWCACQHRKSKFNIDPTQCKHINIEGSTRHCVLCGKTIALTMTKPQVKALLYDFVEAFKNGKLSTAEIYDGYAERILNDRPTQSDSEAQASISGL